MRAKILESIRSEPGKQISLKTTEGNSRLINCWFKLLKLYSISLENFDPRKDYILVSKVLPNRITVYEVLLAKAYHKTGHDRSREYDPELIHAFSFYNNLFRNIEYLASDYTGNWFLIELK